MNNGSAGSNISNTQTVGCYSVLGLVLR